MASSLYARLVVIGEPCEMDSNCSRSKANAGKAADCNVCQWSPEEPINGRDRYKPIDKRVHFSRRERADREAARERLEQRRKERAEKDKDRVRVGRQAARAERRTERSIIKATVNSGRLLNDGDHLSVGSIVLDTKLQSAREHPAIQLDQMAKVRLQARRAGCPVGALVLRNKHGQGFVVFAEEDYALLAKALKGDNEQQTSES